MNSVLVTQSFSGNRGGMGKLTRLQCGTVEDVFGAADRGLMCSGADPRLLPSLQHHPTSAPQAVPGTEHRGQRRGSVRRVPRGQDDPGEHQLFGGIVH